MLENQRIFVVVPAFREQALIGRTLASVPAFVDGVIVVDDASDDATAERARASQDPRVQIVCHAENAGVGRSIVTGYVAAAAAGADAVVVMAGDAQMDPRDLPALLAPLLAKTADYVKGNRFLHPRHRQMPWPRRLAGKVLSLATRLASGLAVDDCQCGYTAVTRSALASLPLLELWPRFGYPNDLLLLLSAAGLRVAEVPVRPVYGTERSGVRPWHALVILGLIAWRARWVRRARRPEVDARAVRTHPELARPRPEAPASNPACN